MKVARFVGLVLLLAAAWLFYLLAIGVGPT